MFKFIIILNAHFGIKYVNYSINETHLNNLEDPPQFESEYKAKGDNIIVFQIKWRFLKFRWILNILVAVSVLIKNTYESSNGNNDEN